MTEKTKIRLVVGLFILFLVLCMMFMVFLIWEEVWGEEILVNEYPFWAKDSTFQTVQIIKCWERFPNGQRKLLGYKVVVDSSGICIYEEKPEYFLTQAVLQALNLWDSLGKVEQKGDLNETKTYDGIRNYYEKEMG